MNDQQTERLHQLLAADDNSAFLQRLLSHGGPKVLYSRPVVEFVIAYGKATEAHLPVVRSAGEKAYNEKNAQGLSVEDAEQAAYTARLNEYLTVPFPPFPGCEAHSSMPAAAPYSSPSPEGDDLTALVVEEQTP